LQVHLHEPRSYNELMANKSVTVSIPHKLSQEEARQRIVRGLAKLQTEQAAKLAQVQESWTGNHLDFSLSAMGQALSGRVDVDPDKIRLEVDLPWMLAMFAEKFRPRIEEEGRKMLEDKS
jgi:hypothetical protein